jgi:hypothetical protein
MALLYTSIHAPFVLEAMCMHGSSRTCLSTAAESSNWQERVRDYISVRAVGPRFSEAAPWNATKTYFIMGTVLHKGNKSSRIHRVLGDVARVADRCNPTICR